MITDTLADAAADLKTDLVTYKGAFRREVIILQARLNHLRIVIDEEREKKALAPEPSDKEGSGKDVPITNHYGECVYLKPLYHKDRCIGLTDCCLVYDPCAKHNVIFDPYISINVKVDDGLFSICARDGGIEVIRPDGRVVSIRATSTKVLALDQQVPVVFGALAATVPGPE